MPAATLRTTLFSKRTCSTTHHVQAAARVARRQHDGVAGLRFLPMVLEDVVLDDHVAGVLQLEQVLHRPHRAGAGRHGAAVPAAPVSTNTCRSRSSRSPSRTGGAAVDPVLGGVRRPACHVSRTAPPARSPLTATSAEAVDRPIVPCPTGAGRRSGRRRCRPRARRRPRCGGTFLRRRDDRIAPRHRPREEIAAERRCRPPPGSGSPDRSHRTSRSRRPPRDSCSRSRSGPGRSSRRSPGCRCRRPCSPRCASPGWSRRGVQRDAALLPHSASPCT